MELWFSELHAPSLSLSFRIRRTLERVATEHHELAVLDSEAYGRMLVLDGAVQLTLADEFVYHEMLAHVPLCAHGRARRVLVVGGGDGGTVREVLRHPEVEQVVLAEIDGQVVEASRRHLPEVSAGLSDSRVRVEIGDAVAHVAAHPDSYDAILIDSTDPVGPGVRLFSREFYEACRRALRPGGIVAAQTESPFLHGELIARAVRDFGSVFPKVALYLATVPTYPGALWSFTVGSLGPEPSAPQPPYAVEGPPGTRYYTPEVHRAAFVLPPFVRSIAGLADR